MEAKYGRTSDDWKTAMSESGRASHKELVDWL
ncbi:DUF4287 domain-containing protein, partial [Nocardia cyriacigeorgica]